MKAVALECPKCSGEIPPMVADEAGFCPYCGVQLVIDDEVLRAEVKHVVSHGETRRCKTCGRSLLEGRDVDYICPRCSRDTCPDCYDKSLRRCNTCAENTELCPRCSEQGARSELTCTTFYCPECKARSASPGPCPKCKQSKHKDVEQRAAAFRCGRCGYEKAQHSLPDTPSTTGEKIAIFLVTVIFLAIGFGMVCGK